VSQSAILPYFGSKRTLAGRIVETVGDHSAYFEPFCGSLAVLLSKPVCRMETAVDLYGDLVNLARVIQTRETAERLYAALYPMIPCNALHEEAKARVAAADGGDGQALDVARAVDFFVCSWLGRNGCIGTRQFNNNFCVRYTSNGGTPAGRWKSAVGSIPDWHERLKNVVILRTCGIAVCERVEDKAGTVVYADPPYLVKGAAYVHDFDSADHQRLAAALARFEKTRVVVSYYEHPRLSDLYPGWRRIPVTLTKTLVNQGRRDGDGEAAKAPEVLLVNWREGRA
jgi:DNA adenine methylase